MRLRKVSEPNTLKTYRAMVEPDCRRSQTCPRRSQDRPWMLQRHYSASWDLHWLCLSVQQRCLCSLRGCLREGAGPRHLAWRPPKPLSSSPSGGRVSSCAGTHSVSKVPCQAISSCSSQTCQECNPETFFSSRLPHLSPFPELPCDQSFTCEYDAPSAAVIFFSLRE